MEEITEAVGNLDLNIEAHKKNRIQVSNTKKPLFFYVNLAKVTYGSRVYPRVPVRSCAPCVSAGILGLVLDLPAQLCGPHDVWSTFRPRQALFGALSADTQCGQAAPVTPPVDLVAE
ncbi:hypothetical protein KI387_020026 [Taxus chinensis]|uniref:Uncharacterized protein n=1 Tax=Taxus chinensis TaxID=29808 RepID=A0AA38GAB1_TAXCH|nr:hypothetical protein KI387_020026 [Taxus chinensis]